MTTMYELAQQDYRQPKDVPELRRYLQAALEIEHLTIPVYMTGMYSIKPGTNAYAYGVIRSVLLEEMLHMALAANLLTAVGGKADVSKFVRKYPAKLPFADKRVPEVRLRHYSPEALAAFLDIERPQSFVPPNGQKPTGWTSIGQFYDAIRRGVTDLEQAAREQEPPSTIFTGVAGDQIGPRALYNSRGAVIGGVFLFELLLTVGFWVINPGTAKQITAAIPANVNNTEAIGLVLYTKYIHYFQLAGMVLLVAMVGAIVLTLRHKANVKRQNISVQNARTKATAMRVVKVAPGQGLGDLPPREAAE